MRKFAGYFFAIVATMILADWLFHLPQEIFDTGGYNPSVKNALGKVDFAAFPVAELKQYITQGYGATLFAALNYIGRWHNGIDIAAVEGAPIYSPAGGAVVLAGDQDNYCYGRGFGKFALILDSDGKYALFYAHLSKISVKAGDWIKPHGIVGFVGRTGFATAAHLHFSVFEARGLGVTTRNGCGPNPAGRDVNPIAYLDALGVK